MCSHHELAVKGNTARLAVLSLEAKKHFALLDTKRPQALLQVIEKLRPREIEKLWRTRRTHGLNVLRALDHLLLGDIVGPCSVAQETRELSAQFQGLIQQWYVDFQTSLVALMGPFPGHRVVRILKL
jgi:hypothetical protein